MATSPTSSEWFGNSTVKKGAVGERILSRVAATFFPGANSYVPLEEDGAHQFDRILVHWNDKKIILVDAKSKPARTHWPDTGIDVRHFETYSDIGRRHRAPVLLAFIDEGMGKCYGNLLWMLAKQHRIFWRGENLPYPKRETDARMCTIIYFPIEYMRELAALTSDEVDELQRLSTRKGYPVSPEVSARLGRALRPNSFWPSQMEFKTSVEAGA